jgi:pSer/pThr/pTyr-binding forkhead associated (FHA) protein
MAEAAGEKGTAHRSRCPSCGTLNTEGAVTCADCGALLEGHPPRESDVTSGESLTCPKCEKPIPRGSRFCTSCGATVRLAEPPQAAKDPALEHMTVRVAVPPMGRSGVPASLVDAPTAEHATPESGRSAAGDSMDAAAAPKIEAMITELKPDGSTGQARTVRGQISVGRHNCDLTYSNDGLLAPRHALLEFREDRLVLKDCNSQNGTFIKQRQDSELNPGDVFLLGRDLFRFTTQSLDGNPGLIPNQTTQFVVGAPRLQKGPITAKLEHIQLDGSVIEEFGLEKPETTIGRTRGDLVFKADPYMSGIHARVVAQPGRFLLQDLKSKNGVYRRIRSEVDLKDGDEFFLGEQLFRVLVRAVIS